MFAGMPDFHTELIRRVSDGDTTWTEMVWSGTREHGEPFEARGVALFEISDGLIVAARLYMEEVARESGGIAQAVEGVSGRLPRTAGT
jgi:ketosteroid isomerase-like protein